MSAPQLSDITPQSGIILGRGLKPVKTTEILLPGSTEATAGEGLRLLVLLSGAEAMKLGVKPGDVVIFGQPMCVMKAHVDGAVIDLVAVDAGFVISSYSGVDVHESEYLDFTPKPQLIKTPMRA